jgi:hypothetical protein
MSREGILTAGCAVPAVWVRENVAAADAVDEGQNVMVEGDASAP